MPDHRVSADKHERIFGRPSVTGARPGRRRFYLCKVCGGEHQRGHTPHNCREPMPVRQHLASPQLAPSFHEHRTGVLDGAEIITSRNEQREYMKRHDLIQWEEGIGKRNEWVEEHETKREIIQTIKMAMERDPLSLTPEEKGLPLDEKGSLDEGTEIDTTDMEIIK